MTAEGLRPGNQSPFDFGAVACDVLYAERQIAAEGAHGVWSMRLVLSAVSPTAGLRTAPGGCR